MNFKEQVLSMLNILKEDTTANFRSDILKAAENNELTTPGHILHYLSTHGKVPSDYHNQSKAMKFVIDTIGSYGGHFESTNPKLMKYIDNMLIN